MDANKTPRQVAPVADPLQLPDLLTGEPSPELLHTLLRMRRGLIEVVRSIEDYLQLPESNRAIVSRSKRG